MPTTTQREAPKQREVEFLLTFEEWWAIWEASGKWEQRGRDTEAICAWPDYGDAGPYAIGNVKICTNEENNSEAHSGKYVSDATRKRLSKLREGPWADK